MCKLKRQLLIVGLVCIPFILLLFRLAPYHSYVKTKAKLLLGDYGAKKNEQFTPGYFLRLIKNLAVLIDYNIIEYNSELAGVTTLCNGL